MRTIVIDFWDEVVTRSHMSAYKPLPPEQFKAAFEQAKADREVFLREQQLREEKAGEALLDQRLKTRRQERALDFAI